MKTKAEIQAQIDILEEYDLENFCEGLKEKLQQQLLEAKSSNISIKKTFKSGFFAFEEFDKEYGYLDRTEVVELAYKDFIKNINLSSEIDLTGLLKDGYTFICPIHGLHPNCDCSENQIKVWNNDVVDHLTEIQSKLNYEAAMEVYNNTEIVDFRDLENLAEKSIRIAAYGN